MHRIIDGKRIEVVEFDTMPELPITGLMVSTWPSYIQVLNDAFECGIITEPGKYGIELKPGSRDYVIHKIVD